MVCLWIGVGLYAAGKIADCVEEFSAKTMAGWLQILNHLNFVRFETQILAKILHNFVGQRCNSCARWRIDEFRSSVTLASTAPICIFYSAHPAKSSLNWRPIMSTIKLAKQTVYKWPLIFEIKFNDLVSLLSYYSYSSANIKGSPTEPHWKKKPL